MAKPFLGDITEMSKDDSIANQVTTDQLVAKIVAPLRGGDQVDPELLDILSENIVKMAPAEIAVNDAVKAIEALAEKRVEEPGNGPADYD
jgi:hypothetical protein